MSETIMCAECPRVLEWEDAESVLVRSGEAEPWARSDETTAPVYLLACPLCAARHGHR